MSFLDKLKNTAGSAMAAVSDAAKDVSDKGKEMTEKARINKAIKNEQTKVNNLYMIIGQKVFEQNASAPAGLEDQFNGIRTAKAEIERLQKEADLMSANASPKCPSCGADVSAGQPFCQKCGTRLGTAPAQTVNSAPETQPETPETTDNNTAK